MFLVIMNVYHMRTKDAITLHPPCWEIKLDEFPGTLLLINYLNIMQNADLKLEHKYMIKVETNVTNKCPFED